MSRYAFARGWYWLRGSASWHYFARPELSACKLWDYTRGVPYEAVRPRADDVCADCLAAFTGEAK